MPEKGVERFREHVEGQGGRRRLRFADLEPPDFPAAVLPGPSAEEKLEYVLQEQKKLLFAWLHWLAEGRKPGKEEKNQEHEYPRYIMPRESLETTIATLRFVPQLADRAETLSLLLQKICAGYCAFLGPENSHFETTPQLKKVVLHGHFAGGYAGGGGIGVAATGPTEGMAAVLAHEIGHTLLGGGEHAITEGFAEYLMIHGLRYAGYTEFADETLAKRLRIFEEADPTHRVIDSSTVHSKAATTKWIWILTELEKKYGSSFFREYATALRTSDKFKLIGSHDKEVNGKRSRLTTDDIVHHMSIAAGEDLRPWFRELGIKVR